VRASWFNQNFSEGAFVDMVQAGRITLPEVGTPEPFVDVDDIADVIVAALTQPGHAGELYEVTGPRMLTLAEVASELSKATGRQIEYVPVPHEAFLQGVADTGAPQDVLWMLDYLFATVLAGRNAYLTDGVQRALGRPRAIPGGQHPDPGRAPRPRCGARTLPTFELIRQRETTS